MSATESHTFAYLGPVGTFTEAALKKITCDTDVKIPYANVTAALDAVRKGEAQYALVPIENSVEGVVARTLDELASGDPLTIASEVTLPVTFAFMTKPGATTIKRIGTHPHAESQCRAYIAATNAIPRDALNDISIESDVKGNFITTTWIDVMHLRIKGCIELLILRILIVIKNHFLVKVIELH